METTRVKDTQITIVPIRGMTCRSCEALISDELADALPDADSIKVSAFRGRAVIGHREDLDMTVVKDAVRVAGYEVGEPDRSWLTSDRKIWREIAITVLIIAALIAVANLTGIARWFSGNDVDIRGNLLLVVLLGVAASVSTCMALVGGLVLSISARNAAQKPDASALARLRPQILFNVGRILGFAGLGAVVGGIGTMFTLSGITLAVAMLAVSAFMGFLGLKLTGLVPRLAGASLALPRGMGTLPNSPLLLGAASFFLPCGFTQAVQVYALSTGSPMQAGLIMALFAIGTAPGLLGVGAFTSVIRGPRAAQALRAVGVLVIGFALINFHGAVNSLGTTLTAPKPTEQPLATTGTQELHTEISQGTYSPAEVTVNAGEPIRWILDVKSLGCANALNATSLGIADIIWLEQGENEIKLPALQPGTYRYSCAMGMYQATITAM